MQQMQSEDDTTSFLQEVRVLVVGAGALGGEIIKNLAMSGMVNLTIVDHALVCAADVARCLLFRPRDVGLSKAEVVAREINCRVVACRCVGRRQSVEDLTADADLQSFNLVITALGAIQPTRELNASLVSLVEVEPRHGTPLPETIVPLVTAVADGWQGQVKVFVPKLTRCFECECSTRYPPTTRPLCSYNVLRLPEHCILRAILFNHRDEDDASVVYDTAVGYADKCGITGITLPLVEMMMDDMRGHVSTLGSTVSTMAGVVALEVVKMITQLSDTNLFHFDGKTGCSSSVMVEKDPHCIVCGRSEYCIQLTDPGETLREFIARIRVL